MHIIDVTGGKLVGRILKDSPTEFILTYPASLTFPIEALDAGRRFAIKASLMGIVAVDKLYWLPKSAVRGYTPCGDRWLEEVYARFERRAVAGEFRLNPYAKQETALLMQGDGEVESESTDVAVIHADPPAAEPAPTANGSADA